MIAVVSGMRVLLIKINCIFRFDISYIKIMTRLPENIAFQLIITAAVCIFSISAYQRNMVWKDDMDLLTDVVKKSPLKARGYNNLGNVYHNRGFTDKAMENLLFALKLKPDYADAHTSLGTAYGARGQISNAIEHFCIALTLNPAHLEAHYNLGLAYFRKGRMAEARYELSIVLKMEPDFYRAMELISRIDKETQ